MCLFSLRSDIAHPVMCHFLFCELIIYVLCSFLYWAVFYWKEIRFLCKV